MPGIIAITPLNDRLLEDMIHSIMHEKWYSIDKYTNSLFGASRVHLGIFNPEQQPIFNHDKTLCIFMDGKIYGYEKEMNELKQKGYKFDYGNDSEFCLYLFEELGKDFVKNLNGSFVIIIYNLKENELLITNDRYGLRPHYYAVNNGKLLFAPEVKAILKDETIKKELNDATVADFFGFAEIWGNKTFFKGIEVLPPASIMKFKNEKISIKQYWDFDYNPDYAKSEDMFLEELVESFRKAVEIRMKDKYRYAISLSGGLDSRSIIAAIEERKKKDTLAFTFGPFDCDEIKIAKLVSKRSGIEIKTIEITPDMIINNAKSEVFYSDGMNYIGTSFIPTTHKFVKNDNRDIVIDGFEFDVILGGSYLNEKIVKTRNKDELLQLLLSYNRLKLFSDIEFRNLFNDNYYRKIKDYPLLSIEKEFKAINEVHPGNQFDHFYLQNHGRRWILGSHILMRTCIENTVPTYDNALIDIILKIPPEFRLNHGIYRKFLKKLSPELSTIPYDHTMVRPDLPLVMWKMGDSFLRIKNRFRKLILSISKGRISISSKRHYVDFEDWLRTNENWKNYFKELLLSDDSLSKKYFNQDFIKKLFEEHESGKCNNSLKIIYIASFELFLEVFMREHCDDIR